jgi:hypothetical protein
VSNHSADGWFALYQGIDRYLYQRSSGLVEVLADIRPAAAVCLQDL